MVAGIGPSTLAEWRERYPDLEERLANAREHARQKALQGIKGAGKKDWRAHAEWLRLTFPGDYRGSGTKVEVSASANVNAGIVITEEQRQEMIAQRKRLEHGTHTPEETKFM